VAFLLLIVGIGGLYIEFTHPGVVLPGLVGALCLLLFALASQILPVSLVGLLLILLGIVMFVLEVKVTSYGMLTLGGTICLVVGSLMLFRGPIPELRLPLTIALPPALALAALCAFAVRLAVRAQRAVVGTGVEGLVGEIGEVTEELAPAGRVFVHGEIWHAVSPSGAAAKGARVRIVKVENMTVTVEPVAGRPVEGS
jgi:membrane-bound serine protease (ClpP class)